MPNYSVTNFDVAKLKTQIYGSNTALPVSTDADGKLQIRSISDTVNVSITGEVNMRDLTADSDSILIYGYDGTNIQRIKTDTDGNIRTHVTARDFTEASQADLSSADTFTNSTSQDTSQYRVYSFAVYNTGNTNSLDAQLEVSPDDTMWTVDQGPRPITAGSMDVFYPAAFLKYTRIAYKSTAPGDATSLDIYYQAQI